MSPHATWVETLLRALDPRRSLAAGAMWLIIALTAAFSIAAAVWVGRIARENVLEQHIRRLSLETDQLSSDLGQALAGRLDAVRAAERVLKGQLTGSADDRLGAMYAELLSAYPQYDWIAVADARGTVLAASDADGIGGNVQARDWFAGGMRGPWLGVVEPGPAGRPPHEVNTAVLGAMAAPVRDGSGRVAGVIAARLSWQRAPGHPQRLTDEPDPDSAAEALVLDGRDVVRIGPPSLRNKPWNAIPLDQPAPPPSAHAPPVPHFERLPGGRRVLVSRALLDAGADAARAGWQVQLTEPIGRVYQRARAVTYQILWVSLGLGAATALLGLLGARKLTGRLRHLAESVAAVGHNEAATLQIPPGADEVAQLARAFEKILGDLHAERRELQTLSSELERRVAVRTHEVERLAEESRYAAVVRERLKIARDLHDTLAHSMMALLSEVRYLRRLHARDPSALAEELARAEKLAHEGLNEARSAITQMRVNAVRDTGLGAALSRELSRFLDRTGITGELDSDAESAGFGDERAETLLRIAQEALRNVERHSAATHVRIKLATCNGELELRVEDNGVGFDPSTPKQDHYGLIGLREQSDLIGARLQIHSSAQRGTVISVKLRVAPAAFSDPTQTAAARH